MRIAILGATSQIAKDLIKCFLEKNDHDLTLFARRPDAVEHWLSSVDHSNRPVISNFDHFSTEKTFDAIINFVGAGNPATALAMGRKIFETTRQFDQIALDYLASHTDCRYIFLSSGATYGSSFLVPPNMHTHATVEINQPQPADWYGISKLCTELNHRSLDHLGIVDVRIFSYFSRSQDLGAQFFISEILRAIHNRSTLEVSSDHIVRDYLHPVDFHQLIEKVLASPFENRVLDCYSRAPVSKKALLQFMSENFGLVYKEAKKNGLPKINTKVNYYPTGKQASSIGYAPLYSSLEGIEIEARAILDSLPKQHFLE
ncbi:NAD(P)-dependent oxidoreductase [Comamonas sp. NLF-1-9]|uniref:NAD-dependent epimerase/dehydratase family protein n=1 Tax=Comamonas sp. NLF-1-9 TaxID=2853163 RepID=UPI001C48B921|nr:NAD(P)-dependent oxidoreductase [Comamonas sp. NLF-1-9]QXL84222.1 NAD(P)-dependent oxidoreductase [Comamonas sp. NLF-1-9]